MGVVQLIVLGAGLLTVLAFVAIAPKTRRSSATARKRTASPPKPARPWGEQVGLASAAQADARAAREHEQRIRRTATPRPSLERRREVRRPVSRPAWVVRAGSGEPPQRTFTVDLAERGALIAGPASLSPGEQVLLRVDLAGVGEVECAAEVVRVTPEGHRALAFGALPQRFAQALAGAAA